MMYSSPSMGFGVYLARKYLSVIPAYAPKYWREPVPLERAKMEYTDECAGGFLKWFPSLTLSGKDVFDIGCGYGGRPVRYAELGARSVTGIEIVQPAVMEATAFAKSHGIRNARFLVAVGEKLPFPSACFDIITSYDVFEHVENLDETLRECLRVLRVGGVIYAVFPPFYHPTGAHLESWLSKMPWPHVIFKPETLLQAGYEILGRRQDHFYPNELRSSDKLWNLNGATIRSTFKVLKQIGCKYTLSLAPLFSRHNSKWERWHLEYYAWIVSPLRYAPLLREAFTHRIVLTATKQ